MTRWRDTRKQVDRSLYIQPLHGVYCSAMDASSALNICEYLNTTTMHAFDLSTIIIFVYLGLQVKWNPFSSNNSHHTGCIHKGSHPGKWPDLMTSKPDSSSTLGYQWTYHTGRPLEPQVHWDATGTTLADASTQWCPSGDPVLICINGTHWKNTGKPLEDHWKHTGHHQFFLQWNSSVHWGLSSRHTGLPLEDHWLRVGVSIPCPALVISFVQETLQIHILAQGALYLFSILSTVCAIIYYSWYHTYRSSKKDNSMLKSMLVDYQALSNQFSDWVVALPTADQKPCQKICVNQEAF